MEGEFCIFKSQPKPLVQLISTFKLVGIDTGVIACVPTYVWYVYR